MDEGSSLQEREGKVEVGPRAGVMAEWVEEAPEELEESDGDRSRDSLESAGE